MSRCSEAGIVITVNVRAYLGIASVSQVAVRVVTRVAVYTASSEFRQRIQVIHVGFARFQDPVPFQLRNVCGRGVDPAVVRQLSRCFFNSHETSMTCREAFKKKVWVGKQVHVVNSRLTNDDSWNRGAFGHWFSQVTFGEDKSSNFEGRPHEFLEAAREDGFRTAFPPCALNIDSECHA